MMLRSEKKSSAAAAAVGGRTARVCDSCMCKRARWFCAADDAFLCQSCDVSVHSANQLARRHDRIRLETASFKSQSQAHLPPWPKKARTPRPNKLQILSSNQKASVFSLVPEIGNDDDGLLVDDHNEEQHHTQFLHHQVPVFDPLIEDENFLLTDELEDFGDGFLPSEVELAEFVADVENLLETHQEEEQQQESGLLKVKDEEEQEELEENGAKISGLLCNWNFKGEEIEDEEENKVVPMVQDEEQLLKKNKKKKKKNIFLRLNYDAVIMAWDAQSSPYTTGNRPEFDLDECLLGWSGVGALGGRGESKNDWEREARVSRYREKRRTRLFSKKIRYQVRKLNAEKRPRMKGRFVKRTAPPLIMSSTSISNHITFP